MDPLVTSFVGENSDYFLEWFLDGEILVDAAEFA